MFAYTKNNTLSFISSVELTADFLQDLADYTVIEYPDTITDPILQDGAIIQRPHIETEAEKFERVYQNILSIESLTEDTDHAILEGLTFSDTAIGDVIAHRVFLDPATGKGNPHGQMAMLAKIIANPAYAQDPDAIAKSQAINNIRLFFGLSRLTPEEQAERRAMRGG